MKHMTLSTLSRAGGNILRALSRQLVSNVGTLVLVALLLFAYNAWAAPQAVPLAQAPTGLLSYQGYLTDAGGSPLNGDVNVTFRLYSTPTGGTALWTEAHTGANAVPMSDGLFNVMLGSLTPIPSSVWGHSMLYLGVQVGSDAEMTPREVVGEVPYAIQAGTVSDGSIVTEKIADGAVTSRQAHLNSGRVMASESVGLTTSREVIPGMSASLSPATDQTYLFYLVVEMADYGSTDGYGHARLYVDGVAAPGGYAYMHWDADLGTVAQVYLVDLETGTHTVDVRAASSKGGGSIYKSGTSLTWFAMSQ